MTVYFERGRFVLDLRRGTALVLLLSLVFSAASIPATDFSNPNAFGSVSGTGSILLRGVVLNQEGTVFPGDAVQLGRESYARLALANGNKVELFSNTGCVVNRNGPSIWVYFIAGNVGFATSNSPLEIKVGPYQVTPGTNTTGGVAFIGGDFLGIRVLSGNALVGNPKTGKNVRVVPGDVQILNLRTEEMNVPLSQLAFLNPASVAADTQVAPGQRPSGEPTGRPTDTEAQGFNWILWGIIAAGTGAVLTKVMTSGGTIYKPTQGTASPSK